MDSTQGEDDLKHMHGQKLEAKALRKLEEHAKEALNPVSLPSGPITRARAKRFKMALQSFIQAQLNTTHTKGCLMDDMKDNGLIMLIQTHNEVQNQQAVQVIMKEL